MKKLGAGLAALGIVLIMAVGCGSSANDSSSSDGGNSTGGAKSNIQATEALVLQVQVGMTEQEVRELLGEPERKLPMKDPRHAGWMYTWGSGANDGTVVAFLDGKVGELPQIGNNPR